MTGQDELCQKFWADKSRMEEPLRQLLHQARGVFPALPVPLPRMLSALASWRGGALSAAGYLACTPFIASLHELDDHFLKHIGPAEVPGRTDVMAVGAVPIPGLSDFTVPAVRIA